MKSGFLLFAAAAVASAVQTLPAQQAAQPTLLRVAESEGVVMSLDSASIIRSGTSSFVVSTVTRFAEPVPREEGDSVDTEVDREEIECAGQRVRGFSAELFLAGRPVDATPLPTTWAPVPPGRVPVVQAICALLMGSFAAALPVTRHDADVDERPELLSTDYLFNRLMREYPTVFRNPNFAADVTLQFRVAADGRVEPHTVRILSSTQPELLNALRRVVPGMRFRPARVGGKPVAAWYTLPLGLERRVTTEHVIRP